MLRITSIFTWITHGQEAIWIYKIYKIYKIYHYAIRNLVFSKKTYLISFALHRKITFKIIFLSHVLIFLNEFSTENFYIKLTEYLVITKKKRTRLFRVDSLIIEARLDKASPSGIDKLINLINNFVLVSLGTLFSHLTDVSSARKRECALLLKRRFWHNPRCIIWKWRKRERPRT